MTFIKDWYGIVTYTNKKCFKIGKNWIKIGNFWPLYVLDVENVFRSHLLKSTFTYSCFYIYRQEIPETSLKKKKNMKWRGERALSSHRLHCVMLWLPLLLKSFLALGAITCQEDGLEIYTNWTTTDFDYHNTSSLRSDYLFLSRGSTLGDSKDLFIASSCVWDIVCDFAHGHCCNRITLLMWSKWSYSDVCSKGLWESFNNCAWQFPNIKMWMMAVQRFVGSCCSGGPVRRTQICLTNEYLSPCLKVAGV